METIAYAIINENTLAYVFFQGNLLFGGVLGSSIIKGGRHWIDGPFIISKSDRVRLATEKDFETFRVSYCEVAKLMTMPQKSEDLKQALLKLQW